MEVERNILRSCFENVKLRLIHVGQNQIDFKRKSKAVTLFIVYKFNMESRD